ncbi:Retrovirus-related Pol polyprotein from type-1 retrotransposable element R2 [Frankliniella fusca]|uniref:Retrovirus-related Pol polyprotein from type-1 retrotransposable element R2 n=1 Tax=Frankliniella fusca TaxID=407009 RepID=A0AAE1HDB4_9NEOP|nr:Retrovirus-related Pol polyprotein from type-1 retrotransposable element R2 [Frankliniella fusca]
MDENHVLYTALPLGNSYHCPICKFYQVKGQNPFDQLKKHMNNKHGGVEVEDEGVIACSFEELQDAIIARTQQVATPAPAQPPSPQGSPSPSSRTPSARTSRQRGAALQARQAIANSELLTPPDVPLPLRRTPGANRRQLPSTPEPLRDEPFLSPSQSEDTAPRLSKWQENWLLKLNEDISWEELLQTLDELTKSITPPENPTPGGKPPRGKHQGVKAAARIQRIYRREGCARAGEPPESIILPDQAPPPDLLAEVNPEDIKIILDKVSNTAPGPDRTNYACWKRHDSSGIVLARIFSICLRHRKFPPSWKESMTVLIYKKGDKDDLSNWRPIALSNCAGKIFCSLISRRLGKWAATYNLLLWAQKGFTPTEGCLEHNFML